MPPPVIDVEHVTKEFRLGQLTSLTKSLRNSVQRVLGRPVTERAAFKALDDVSISVQQGEVLGIIGHNGAGKSTLLKLLAGISRPTRGRVRVRGRVAPLIEVGAGLVPDMTGRENVYLNATILGMRRAEIQRKFDEIVAFAELEEFIDTPIKRYSSGMQVRLGFAIATAVESEILIVDEVLAVGDLAFQRRCFDRVRSIIDRRDRTVLLVSHNIRQVDRLCSRVLLMDHGRLMLDGVPSLVCDAFYGAMNHKASEPADQASISAARYVSSDEATLLSVDIVADGGRLVGDIISSESLCIRVRLRLSQRVSGCEFHIGTHTTDFFYLTGGSSAISGLRPDLEPGVYDIVQRIDSYPAKAGTYCVRFAMLDGIGRVVFNGENLRSFRVRARPGESLQDELRVFDLPMSWHVEPSENETGMHFASLVPVAQ